MELLDNFFYISKKEDNRQLYSENNDINYILNKIEFLHMNINITINITNLPNTLKLLLFHDDFNKKIKLPFKLKKLSIGNSFNQKNKLNNSLEILILGKKFICNYNNLPKLLKKISFRTSIEYLKSQTSINRNGDLINKMYIRINLPQLSGNKKIIINKYEYNKINSRKFPMYINNLPQLTLIILENDFNTKLNYAPQSLKQLICGEKYDNYFDDISQNMKILILMKKYENKIRKTPLKLNKIIFIHKTQDNIGKIFKNYKKLIQKNIIKKNDDSYKLFDKVIYQNIKLIHCNKFDKRIFVE